LGPLIIVLTILTLLVWPTLKRKWRAAPEPQAIGRRRVAILSRRRIGKSQSNDVQNKTTPGHIARNEMDTHADTCCAGANWRVMEFTGDICEVTPFLELYEPVNEIPVARCGSVWTSPHTGKEYLLVCDQMLWFGTTLPHSLLNPNQIRAYGIDVNDNPFDPVSDFGIMSNEAFIPFDTTGTVVHFETRALTEEKCRSLPVILLTAEDWDP